MRHWVAAGTALLLVSGGVVRADQSPYAFRVEAGAEYDSNPRRIEKVEQAATDPVIVGAPVARLVISGEMRIPTGDRHALGVLVGGAGKLFTDGDARNEDLVVAQSVLQWNLHAGASTVVGVNGAYYDVYQRGGDDARDFRSVSPGLKIESRFGKNFWFAMGAGYRWLSYKPDDRNSFAGPTAFVQYRHSILGQTKAGNADWDWVLNISGERRRFDGPACNVARCEAENDRHRDWFWFGTGEVTRTASFLMGIGLSAHVNRSNSFGQSLVRAMAHVRTVFLLPWSLSLSARAELVDTRYKDPVPLSSSPITGTPLVSIEDESRSTLRLELLRPLTRQVDIGARYTYYTNEIRSSPVHFRRHVGLVFLAATWER